jgi:hypothetical protein
MASSSLEVYGAHTAGQSVDLSPDTTPGLRSTVNIMIPKSSTSRRLKRSLAKRLLSPILRVDDSYYKPRTLAGKAVSQFHKFDVRPRLGTAGKTGIEHSSS